MVPGTVPDGALVGGQADRLQPQHGVQVGQVLRPQLRLQAVLRQGPLIQTLPNTRKNKLVKFPKIRLQAELISLLVTTGHHSYHLCCSDCPL